MSFMMELESQPLTKVSMIGNYIDKNTQSYGYKAVQGFC